jgi:hypothetical protein
MDNYLILIPSGLVKKRSNLDIVCNVTWLQGKLEEATAAFRQAGAPERATELLADMSDTDHLEVTLASISLADLGRLSSNRHASALSSDPGAEAAADKLLEVCKM